MGHPGFYCTSPGVGKCPNVSPNRDTAHYLAKRRTRAVNDEAEPGAVQARGQVERLQTAQARRPRANPPCSNPEHSCLNAAVVLTSPAGLPLSRQRHTLNFTAELVEASTTSGQGRDHTKTVDRFRACAKVSGLRSTR